MKKSLVIFSLLMVVLLLASCSEKNVAGNSEAPKTNVSIKPTSNAALSLATTKGPTSITRNIKRDKNGQLLLAAYEGIFRYDGKTFTNLTKAIGLDSCFAFDVLEDSRGNLWIASRLAGVFRYDGKSVKHFTTQNGLAHNRTIKVYEDKKGNIWFATQGGASCYNGMFFTNLSTDNGLSNNDVNDILEDKNGQFWIGTGGDACVYDGEIVTTITKKDGGTFKNVRSIMEDERGDIWLAGSDGLWRYDGNSYAKVAAGMAGGIYEDTKGNIWMTHQPSGNAQFALSYFDKESLLTDQPVATQVASATGMFFGVNEDQAGNIWVGTLAGVFRYDGDKVDYFK